MSQIDENEIYDRLKRLLQVEPTKEASDRAIQRARNALMAGENRRVGFTPPSLIGGLMKLTAAAVLMIGAGFIGGRLSAPEPINVQEFQAALESSIKSSLEPAIRRQLHDEFENRLQSALTAERNMLKQELAQQVHRDMETYAGQTLTTVGNLIDQRLMEFARMVEAARIKERQRVAAAFDYMGSRFGDGLVTLATRTDNLLDTERAGSTPDVSEN
ncbi:MAG: hypothetical protein JXA81_05745 [Sedimentisphaerales bacterium]|nr:hypothetical protein [Sedimentisphaerales bacterium]